MKELKEESEYVKIQLEDDVNTDVENILKIAYDILKLSINYEEYKNILINITKNYKDIEYTEKNIITYITIVDYFMLNKQEEIFNHIIEKYIIEENKYYEKLNMYNSIDYYIRKKLGTENEINSKTLEYIININNEITELCSCLITQETLNKCKSLVKLNITDNKNIKNVNHLNKLEVLNISGMYCGVNQKGIKNLKLVKNLNAYNNVRIKDVNHLDKLEVLDISGKNCGVNQEGIKNLKSIKALFTYYNTKITDANFYKK